MIVASHVVVATTLAAASLAAQPTGDYGLDFVTIGDPGNPHADPSTYHIPEFGRPSGRVDYNYRIMRSKVDVATWVEFVDVAYPIRSLIGVADFELLGDYVGVDDVFAKPGDDVTTFIRSGGGDWGTTTTWQAATRFANWLHNGKDNSVESFLTGAYDFASGDDLPQRSPDAKFWVPTLDEWNKAVYWDPNKDGPRLGGYWTQPNSSDTRLVPGLPGVGETPALNFLEAPNLGLYPDTQTPWGLIDVSGHRYEVATATEFRGVHGVASRRGPKYTVFDQLGSFASNITSYNSSTVGFRLAAQIPSPSTGIVMLAVFSFTSIRRR